jgi:hypothetical protein
MKVLLFQLDGKIPNLALLRIAAHHRALGDECELRVAGNEAALQPRFGDERISKVYASAIFTRSQSLANRLQKIWPGAVVGGSGIDSPPLLVTSLAKVGIVTRDSDYSVYPRWPHSIGFTQRGCRFTEKTCGHCSVPLREGNARAEDNILSIWRGHPWPKNLLLLDNDTFGNPNWRAEVAAIREGGFKVCWTQGINARMLSDEVCEAIASVHYSDNDFKIRRIYTAWDNSAHELPLFRGLNALIRYGVKADNIMVFLLCGFHDSAEDREYRRRKLRELGCRPYPMPFVRTRELVGFQRWVVGAYDKRVAWSDWVEAKYQPANLGIADGAQVGLNFPASAIGQGVSTTETQSHGENL